MTAYHWISLVTCAGHLTLAILSIMRGWKSPLALVLALLAIDLFSWNAADVAADFSASEAWNRLDHVASAMTMPLAFHFVLLFLGRARELRRVIKLSYFAFVAVAVTDLLSFSVTELKGFGGSKPWAALLLSGVVPEIVTAILFLLRHARRTTNDLERARAWLVLLALLLGFALGATDLLRILGMNVPRLANVGALVSTGLLAAVALRFRLFGDEVPMLHSLAAVGLAALAVVAYLAVFRVFAENIAVLVLGTVTVTAILFMVIRQIAAFSAELRTRRAYLATLGRFSAQMAHDLKNPIATTKGALQFLKEERARGRSLADHSDYLDLLLEQVTRVENVVDRYQSLARVEARPETFSMNDLVRGLLAGVRMREAQRRITLCADLEEALPPCAADKDLFAGVLENLVSNALDAVREDGTVTVRTRSVRNGREGSIAIIVEDDGKGMDARLCERAFDDFFTTKAEGSGLGLPFARRVAEAHGGDIALTSEEDKGTTVTIRIPIR